MRALLDRFIDANHSRLPVYRETLDDISGMIHIKDLLRWMASKGAKARRARKPASETDGDAPCRSPQPISPPKSSRSALLREVLFVPPSMPAADLLIKMQSTPHPSGDRRR